LVNMHWLIRLTHAACRRTKLVEPPR
jgi:hypothetical protein